jgi:hypothetical protein
MTMGAATGDPYIRRWSIESWYRFRAASLFADTLHRVRFVGFSDLAAVRKAHRAGIISRDEWMDLRGLVFLLLGLDDANRLHTIALEVAWRLDEADVSRAARRAAVISRAGLPCTAAVGGSEGQEQILLAAQRAGVAVLREGDIVYWPEAA